MLCQNYICYKMQNQLKSKSPEWTILKLLEWTTSYFKSHNIDSPRATAEILLAYVLKSRRIDLYLRYDQPLYSNELSLFKTLIKRRLSREPVAYIVGVKEFWSLDLVVTKDVLIPRPETECLVEAAISLFPDDLNSGLKPKRILEPGTGSGAIILALASKCKGNIFFASDRSIKAIKLALLNAKHNNLDGTINFFSGDWFAPLKNKTHLFDMIISNPPYIQTRTIDNLEPEIYQYEPRMALDGGEDGLCDLRYIICNAHIYLSQDGYLLLEIGHDQKDDVQEIIDKSGNYEHVIFTKDYSGYYRVVQMRKKDEI